MKGKEENTRDEHPAYGMIMFSRIQGGNRYLYGSSINNEDKILMRVSHGYRERNGNRDWYHAGKLICEVVMSPAQFAEAITSMNNAPGVPVTILATEKDGHIPQLSGFVDKRKQFVDEFKKNNKASLEAADRLIRETVELFQKKNITKKDKEKIISDMYGIRSAVGSHNVFMAEQFNEALDGILTEGRGSMEAFAQRIMTSAAGTVIANGNGNADPAVAARNMKKAMLGESIIEDIPAHPEENGK